MDVLETQGLQTALLLLPEGPEAFPVLGNRLVERPAGRLHRTGLLLIEQIAPEMNDDRVPGDRHGIGMAKTGLLIEINNAVVNAWQQIFPDRLDDIIDRHQLPQIGKPRSGGVIDAVAIENIRRRTAATDCIGLGENFILTEQAQTHRLSGLPAPFLHDEFNRVSLFGVIALRPPDLERTLLIRARISAGCLRRATGRDAEQNAAQAKQDPAAVHWPDRDHGRHPCCRRADSCRFDLNSGCMAVSRAACITRSSAERTIEPTSARPPPG